MKKYDCSHPFTPDPRRGGACAGSRGEGCDHPRECHPPEALAACRAALLTACPNPELVFRLWTEKQFFTMVDVDDAAACMERYGREVAAQLGKQLLNPANWKRGNGAAVVETALHAALAAAMGERDG